MEKTWSKVKGPTNDWAPLFEDSAETKSQKMGNGLLAELVYGDEDEWKKHFDFLPANNMDAFVFIGEFSNKAADEGIFSNLIKNNCLFQVTY